MRTNLLTSFLLCVLVALSAVGQSVPATPAQAPNVMQPGPQKHGPTATPQTGTLEGYVYWDTGAFQYNHYSQCQGLIVAVSVGMPPTGGTPTFEQYKLLGSYTNNFTAFSNVGSYAVCTYSVDKVPIGHDLQVGVTAEASAFVPQATAVTPLTANNPNSPINIAGGTCSKVPPAAPSASVLGSRWWTCGPYAYNVNFQLQPSTSSQVLTGGGPGLMSPPGTVTGGSTQAKSVPSGTTQRTLLSSGAGPTTQSGMLLDPTRQVIADGTKSRSSPAALGRALTVANVVSMLKSRLAESVIIHSIQTSTKRFDFSPENCQALQRARVSANILAAMGDGSVRPCAEITGNGAMNGPGLTDPDRQAITDLTNRGTSSSAPPTPASKVELNPQPLPPRTAVTGAGATSEAASQNSLVLPRGAKGAPVARTALKPVKLAPPKALRKVANPHLSEQNASIIAVLEQQRQAAQQEAAAMKARVGTVASVSSVRPPALQANLRGSVPAQGLGPSHTQDAQGNVSSSITHERFFVDDTVLTCSRDSTPRVLRAGGGSAPSIFTPEAKYNLYTIVGCSFGQSQSGNWAYIFGVNGFKANLNIDFWSDNGITVHLDPWLGGVLDQDNVTLVVAPAGKQQIQKQGFKFYAARGMPAPDGSDQEVSLAYDSMAQASVKLYDSSPVLAGWNQVPSNAGSQFPSFSFQGTPVAAWVFRYAYGHRDDSYPIKVPCYVNDIPNNCGGDYFSQVGFAPGATDAWDFGKLAPGFALSSYELFYESTDASTLCGAWDDGGKHSGLAGNWDANMNSQNQVVVSWPVYWCADWESMPFANRTNKQVQSAYGLAVWVLGPRCVDPWTGQKDQSCMAKVKQILG